jgi:hypothetical protein
MEKQEKSTVTVAKINNIDIQIVQNGQKLVPIKPICTLLGIDFASQQQRINRDPILKSVVVMTTTTGSDQKSYEMLAIPFRFVFGWLFTISIDRVKPEAKEAILNYKLECYEALWSHFSGHSEFVEFRQKKIDKQLSEVDVAKKQFNSAKGVLDEMKKELDKWRGFTFEDYQAEKAQLEITFEEGGE